MPTDMRTVSVREFLITESLFCIIIVAIDITVGQPNTSLSPLKYSIELMDTN